MTDPTPLDPSEPTVAAPAPAGQATTIDAETQPTRPADDIGPGLPTVPGYEILAVLGRGGMGVVYQARQVALKRLVALKMILAAGHASASDRARFRVEAEAVARLQHPNVVQVHEVGEADGQPYCALELLTGGSLKEKLAGSPLAPQAAAGLVELLARGMNAAHAAGVVHRDLKPANVLFAADGTPKVTDFGLAKRLDDDSLQTRTGAVMGTPSYMAPEQAEGRAAEAGPLADVYALGAILYECLTGRPPFKAATVLETLDQVRSQEPVPVRSLNPAVPRDLETVCLKALEKAPARRYASAGDLADDLKRFQAGEPVRARPVGAAGRLWRWCRRNRAVALLVAAVFLTLAAGAAVATWFAVAATLAGQAKGVALRKSEDAEAVRTLALAVAEWERGNAERAGDLLDRVPPRCRDWEWYYLKRHFRGGQALLCGHLGSVEAVVFRPDGLVATAGLDGAVRVWDPVTDREVAALAWHEPDEVSVARPAFSPDGRRVATTVLGGEVRIWDVDTGEVLHALEDDDLTVFEAAFDPAGRRLATVSTNGKIHVWDAATGERLAVFDGPAGGAKGVAFGPGDRLAFAGSGTVRVWDVAAGRELLALRGHGGMVASVAFSPDGTRLASGGMDYASGAAGEIKLWDARTGRELHSLRGHDGTVESVCFSPDGLRIVSGGFDGTVRVWDVAFGLERRVLRGHYVRVRAVAFSPDGQRLATGSHDATARVWDARVAQGFVPVQGHDGSVRSVAFRPDGRRLVTGGHDRTARLVDARTWEEVAVLAGHAGPVGEAAFSPDGAAVATASDDRTARVWDAATGAVLLRLVGHADRVTGVAFSPDGGTVATSSADGTARLWDRRTGAARAVLRGHDGAVESVCFSPDGASVVTASADRTARLWDAPSGEERLRLVGHTDRVHHAVFSPDGSRVATGSADRTARLWDAATGEGLAVLEHRGMGVAKRVDVGRVAFSPAAADPQGRATLVTVGSQGAVWLWDIATAQVLFELRDGDSYTMQGACFSPDGTHLAVAAERLGLRVYDARPLPRTTTLVGHTDTVSSLAFRPDGTLLATVAGDRSVRVWDPRTGSLRDHLTGLGQGHYDVAFSEDGRLLHARGHGGNRTWDVASRDVVEVVPPEGPHFATVADSPDGTLIALAWNERVYVHDRTRLPDADERAYRAALARLDLRWQVEEARRHEFERRWFAADFHFGQALAARPDDAALHRRRGQARAELGRWPDARDDFAAAVRLAPDDTEARRGLALVELALGDEPAWRTRCGELLDQLARVPPAGALAVLAAPADPLGRLALVKATAETVPALTKEGIAQARACTVRPASFEPGRLLTLTGTDPVARGAALVRAGRHAEAAALLTRHAQKQASERRPLDGCAELYQALAEVGLGRNDAARRRAERVRAWLGEPAQYAPHRTNAENLTWPERLEADRLFAEIEAAVADPAGP